MFPKLADEFPMDFQPMPSGRLKWFHWTIVMLSMLITIFAWKISRDHINEKIRNQFDREATQVIELIKERMQKYEDALWAGVSTVETNGGDISYASWKTFADNLRIQKRYPGINGIGIIHQIEPNQLSAYLKKQRTTRPEFTIHPHHEINDFWPITFIEPSAPNLKAVGLDIAHEPNRYNAALKARDSGLAQITGSIVLVQDDSRTPGFLFYAPIYSVNDTARKKFKGLVYAPFIMKNLMAGTLERSKRRVSIQIRDAGEVLYDEHTPDHEDYDSNPLFEHKKSIDVYGRKWNFEIASSRSFRLASQNYQPLTILVCGVLIDIALLLIFLSISGSNLKAWTIAQGLSKNYRTTALAYEQQVKALNESAIVAFTDAKGKITFANDKFCEISGYAKEELIGKDHRVLNSSFHPPAFFENMWQTISTGSSWRGQIRNKSKRGDYYWVDTTIVPFKDIKGEIYQYVAIRHDITQQKEMEEKLIQSAKLSALGEMAGGIAHEINNPIAIIAGSAEEIKLLRDLNQMNMPRFDDLIEMILNTVQRIAKIISGLRSFARDGSNDGILEVSLNELIQNTIDFCRERFETHGIELRVIVSKPALKIRCRPVEISQVLLNLLNNAFDAVENTPQPFVEIKTSETSPGIVELSVTDSGKGIPDEIAPKVMQPFFSTKEIGKGTGIGLSVSSGLVRGHKGELILDRSCPNTRFVIRLPIGIDSQEVAA